MRGEIFGVEFHHFKQKMMLQDRARERRVHQRLPGAKGEG
jgi:hypothetical protein